MRNLILVMLLSISCFGYSFVEGTTIGVPSKSPTGIAPVIFINTATGAGVTENPSGEWSVIDLSGIVPDGTKAVRLDGLMLITHGSTSETANLTIAFRSVGETYSYTYNMQVIEASTGNGQRSIGGDWIAIDENKCFEIKWDRTSQGQYPEFSSYGINLRLTAYLR